MDRNDQKILQGNMVFLSTNCEVNDLLISHLVDKRILTMSQQEEFILLIGNTPRTRIVPKFISLLRRRGPKAFHCFMEALIVSGQDFVANQLDERRSMQIQQTLGPAIAATPGAGYGYSGNVHQLDHNQPMQQTNSAIAYPVHQTNSASIYPQYGHDNTQMGAEPYNSVSTNNSCISQPSEGAPATAQSAESTLIDITVQDINQKDPLNMRIIHDLERHYKMDRMPRGRAIILNNTDFINGNGERVTRAGSDFDVVNLTQLFKRLHFDTDIWTNLTGEGIVTRINEERRHHMHRFANAFIMVILSHGCQGSIYGTDWTKINIDKSIFAMFDGQNCPALNLKPKIFLIQACQSESHKAAMDRRDGEPMQPLSPQDEEDLANQIHNGMMFDNEDSNPVLSSHEKADFLMAYSTVPGFKSWRIPELGTWFIREFVQTVCDRAHVNHLADILTEVCGRVRARQVLFRSQGQISQTRTTLSKFLYLLPGYPEHDYGPMKRP